MTGTDPGGLRRDEAETGGGGGGDRSKRTPLSRRGQRTRTNLIESGRQAILERGIDGTRVDDVVTRAGTSHGTFYLYFANIDELVDHIELVCDNETASLLSEALRTEPSPARATALVGAASSIHHRYGEAASPWAQRRNADSRLTYLHEQVVPKVPGGPTDVAGSVRLLSVLAVLDRLVPDGTARAVGIDPYSARTQVSLLVGQLLDR